MTATKHTRNTSKSKALRCERFESVPAHPPVKRQLLQSRLQAKQNTTALRLPELGLQGVFVDNLLVLTAEPPVTLSNVVNLVRDGKYLHGNTDAFIFTTSCWRGRAVYAVLHRRTTADASRKYRKFLASAAVQA